MKAREFDLQVTQVERVVDVKLKNDRAIELLERLQKLSPLYNPIMSAQLEKRLLNCTLTEKENELPIFLHTPTTEIDSKLAFVPPIAHANEHDCCNLHDQLIEMDSVKYLNVHNCHGCIFKIKNIENSAFIRNCTSCEFILSTKQLRIIGSQRCKFVIHTLTEPVIEESLELTFSPLVKSEDNKWNRVRDFSCKSDSFLLLSEQL